MARPWVVGVVVCVAIGSCIVTGVVNVSDSDQPSSKGKIHLLADPAGGEPVVVAVYADGPVEVADVFLRRSTTEGMTWSSAANLSRTAEHTNVVGEPGDSVKPLVAAATSALLVAWVDTYCPGEAQGWHDNDLDGDPTAYHCVYVARSSDRGESFGPAEALTDGTRDAFALALFASTAGAALVWQEDPLGLQPGEGEGPGDGGSGAHTSPGTDIHYTSLDAEPLAAGTPFPAPVALTDNLSEENGEPGASRAQVRLVGATALVVYEESKGGGLGGKWIRYHSFPAFAPPSLEAGTVLSDPAEHARRARIVAQGASAVGPANTRALVLWRQGTENQGGPADILMRRAVGGLGAGSFAPAINLSAAELDEPTSANPDENARAHRAVLRGDAVTAAWVHTPDDAAASAGEAHYDLYLRRSSDGGESFGPPRNVSSLPDHALNVTEPRLVRASAGAGSGRAATSSSSEVVYASYGTQTNAPDPVNLDIGVRRSCDGGAHLERVTWFATGPSAQGEAQLRPVPGSDAVLASWMDDADGDTDLFLARIAWRPCALFADGFEGGTTAAWGLECTRGTCQPVATEPPAP